MQKISPYELTQNPFHLFDKQWALITTKVGYKANAMTASWGGVGILWNKPVAFLFVRPQRFTQQMLEQSKLFSVCFLPEEKREALNYCGVKSGRDEDKLAACGLQVTTMDGAPVIGESELALTCRKLYCQRMSAESILDSSIVSAHYPGEDYHYLYVAEIIGAYQATKEA